MLAKIKVEVSPSSFPSMVMQVEVPSNVDEEEFIDDMLENLIKPEHFEDLVWDFV